VNVGLVRDATVHLDELAVIMGMNNSGKSTVASVIYASVKAANSLTVPTFARAGSPSFSHAGAVSAAVRREITSALDSISASQPTAKPEEIAADFYARIAPGLLNSYGIALIEEVERGLGATIDDLPTRDAVTGRRLPAKITVKTESWEMTVRLTAKGPKASSNFTHDARFETEEVPFSIFEGRRMESFDRGDLYFLGDLMFRPLSTHVFEEFPSSAHYLPAARAGLLQSHRLVAAAMIQRSSYVGLQEMSMPSLSGVVADFVTEILVNTRQRPGPLARQARVVEQRVLQGSVRQVSRDSGYPEIEFRDAHGSHPVHRTSSMVSELAPFVLLLRSSVRPGDLLILEEPESHLHPSAQVELARVLYSVARLGVRVILTTHSDYFLTAMSNRIRQAAISKMRQRRNGPIEASAYWMEVGDEGSRLTPIEFDAFDGIADDSFVAVAAKLYDQRVDQQNRLEGGR
jgi:predicted ATPase